MVEHCNGRYDHVELGHAVEFHCKGQSVQPTTSGSELAMQGTGEGQ